MLRDAEQREDGWFRDTVFDVCVVGSGPAGITVAMRLAAKGYSVGLFEGGGLAPSKASRDIYRGKNVGLDYFPLDACRLRYFGGTSNHWEGRCRLLEPYDFEPHAFSEVNGWPIRRSDLEPYSAEAASIVDLKPARPIFDMFNGASTSLIPFQFQNSPPTRFGEKYKDPLTKSDKISVFLNANLVDLDLTDNRRQVKTALFRSYARPEPFTVRARYFVLCLGGLENPRFLLNATRQVPGGIGNENQLVGRFFCEHPNFRLADLVLEPAVQAKMPILVHYRAKPEFLAANRLDDFSLSVATASTGSRSTIERGIRAALCGVPAMNRVVAAVRGKPISCSDADLAIDASQILNPSSQVRLGNDRDMFGQRRIELNFRLTEGDKQTFRVAATEFGKELARRKVGRLKLRDWLVDKSLSFPTTKEDFVAENHHMCTTRMSDDPKTGVVDRDCRIHSLDNLYIGGSSVFASTGFANPTLTIVHLALRLGDHLDSRLKTG
jgi:choline dehydrogenase-like flavoprotein